MLTKNFYALIAAMVGASPTFTLVGGGSYTIPSTNVIQQITTVATIRNVGTATTPASSAVFFGDGTTAPTENDYKLSGSVITSISSAVPSFAKLDDDSGTGVRVTYTLTNGGSESITITEIGWFIRNISMATWSTTSISNGNTNNTGTYMLDRTLLDTPVTIAPGEVGQVVYELRFVPPVF